MLNFVVSLILLTVLLAAIYKVLPRYNYQMALTSSLERSQLLSSLSGKSLIGWYLGSRRNCIVTVAQRSESKRGRG